MKKSLLIFGTLIIASIFWMKMVKKTNQTDAVYYQNVGLKLNGIIKEIKPLDYGHDYGLISIKVNQTNIPEYDKRDELEKYLGVIKNDQAELVFNSVHAIEIEDSIVIKIQNYKVFRKGQLVYENVIGMPPSNFLFKTYRDVENKIEL